MICYRKATLEDLERVWAYNMAMNPDEPRMERWKESYISRNVEGRAATYVVVIDGEPVGEVTLDYHADAYGNPELRKYLAGRYPAEPMSTLTSEQTKRIVPRHYPFCLFWNLIRTLISQQNSACHLSCL